MTASTGSRGKGPGVLDWLRDPGPAPANLDGPPEACGECSGSGRLPRSCDCPHCTYSDHYSVCDDCDGTGVVTPWTTAQWETYAADVRAGALMVPELLGVSVRRLEAAWKTSTWSGAAGDCVEARTVDGLVYVRDSKDRGGLMLTFSGPAWEAFLAGVKADEFDRPDV